MCQEGVTILPCHSSRVGSRGGDREVFGTSPTGRNIGAAHVPLCQARRPPLDGESFVTGVVRPTCQPRAYSNRLPLIAADEDEAQLYR